MRFMQAHGYAPGPAQHPLWTGAVCGMIGEVAIIPLICYTHACASLAKAIGLGFAPTFVLHGLSMVLAGIIYGALFQRAANDRRGGWLFGISYGFVLWMLGPVTIIQWATGRPVATGIPAMGLIGTQLLYGLVLGISFPWVHRLFQSKLGSRLKKPREAKRHHARRASIPNQQTT